MEDLEKYIKEQQGHLNTEEPNEGHFARFEQKLSSQKKSKRRQLLHKSMQIAAVGLLFVMSSMYVYTRFDQASEDVLVNNEFEEAQFYYKTQISNGLQSIEEMESIIPTDQKSILLDELAMADTLFLDLQEAYKTSPNDERVIKAMLRHYRVKSMVINNILNNLENTTNNTNTTSDEQVKI